MKIKVCVSPRFEDYLHDWYYKYYVLVGGYGSGKSYSTALKIILKCLLEQRKVLVVREVFETLRESCYDVFVEILNGMDMLDPNARVGRTNRVIVRQSPMQIIFPNGSRIIFKGMDKPAKLKSLNGVSIVWLEEAPEIKYAGYKEMIGRIRHPSQSIHFILTMNPVDKNNWTYDHFFIHTGDDGSRVVRLDDEVLYRRKSVVVGNVYYHHSVPEDNFYLPKSYVNQLDELEVYDPDLWRVARLGHFGVNGIRVLPQFSIMPHAAVLDIVKGIDKQYRFVGMDFGFELSYNAIIKCAVDPLTQCLYIYWEYYKNKMTDDATADEMIELGLQKRRIVADCAEPKAIAYFQKRGFEMVPCRKSTSNGVGSRLANTRKIKRFKKVICSTNCLNTIRELSNLTYFVDSNGSIKYDKFNCDPHTFSAIWYALDRYVLPTVKEKHSRKGNS